MKIRIKTWTMCLRNGESYILDTDDFDVSEEELIYCVAHQIYDEKDWR